MYFLTKKLDNTWLAGLCDNSYIYCIGKTIHGIEIYRKDIFDIGKWDLFQSIDFKLYPKSECDGCNAKCMPCTTGIHDNKMWIVATIFAENDDEKLPVLFSIDLNTKAVEKFATKTGKFYITRFIKYICIKCKSLAFKYSNGSNFLNILIQRNTVYNRCCKTDYYGYEPDTKVFWINVDRKFKTCKFGECANPEKTVKYVSKIEIVGNKFLFNLQKLKSDGMRREKLPYTHGEYHSYDITSNNNNFELTKCFSRLGPNFYRSNSNEIWCIFNEKLADNSFKLKNYNLNFDFENGNVSFDHKSSFCVKCNFGDIISDKRIFTTQDFIVFKTKHGICTLINRVLTLSEAAYMALCKIPEPLKTEERSKDVPWMSMEFLYNKLNIPRNVKILHAKNY